MKKTLLATTALAFVAATASAVDVELYGQVNKGVFAFDDGENTDIVVVDNDHSGTRLGVKGAQALDNGLTASVLFEMEMQDNPSNTFSQNIVTGASTTPTNSAATFNSRQARVGLSGSFGGIYVGKQSTATDGVLLSDLTGAQDVMQQEVQNIGGGIRFRDNTGELTATSVSNLTSGAFGERESGIRYDSPIFAGFQGRASIQQGGDVHVGAFYEGAYGEFKMAGSAGVEVNNDRTGLTTAANIVEHEVGGSFSVAHSSGLAGTVAYSTQSLENKTAAADEANTWYAKVGYSWDAFEVAADYSQSEHYNSVAAADDELTSFGLAAQYNLGHGVSLAGLYRNFDADITGTNTESIDLYGVNMRVKF